jgi:hypothetical protein
LPNVSRSVVPTTLARSRNEPRTPAHLTRADTVLRRTLAERDRHLSTVRQAHRDQVVEIGGPRGGGRQREAGRQIVLDRHPRPVRAGRSRTAPQRRQQRVERADRAGIRDRDDKQWRSRKRPGDAATGRVERSVDLADRRGGLDVQHDLGARNRAARHRRELGVRVPDERVRVALWVAVCLGACKCLRSFAALAACLK